MAHFPQTEITGASHTISSHTGATSGLHDNGNVLIGMKRPGFKGVMCYLFPLTGLCLDKGPDGLEVVSGHGVV